MKDWWSISDLLNLRHPDLPSTAPGMRDLAQRRGWHDEGAAALVRTAEKRGQETREYHFKLLPLSIRNFVILSANPPSPMPAEHRVSQAEAHRRSSMWRSYDRATPKAKEKAAFRNECMVAIDALIPPYSMRGAASVVGKSKDVPVRTLMSWWKLVDGVHRADWRAALLPSSSQGRPPKEIDPRIFDLFKTCWLRPEAPSLEHAHSDTVEGAEKNGWGKVPTAKTLRAHILNEIGPEGVDLARKGKAALADLYPHQTRGKGERAMEIVNADGHVFDVFVRWEDGTIGRPVLLGFQDIYSNFILSYRIARTETKELIRLALGDMVRDHGIPEQVYFDNGRAFASKDITGSAADHRFRGKIKAEDPMGVLGFLNSKVHFTKPYHGQSKPVERAWRDIADRVAKHIRFAGAYVGNKPDAKPENYGSRAIMIEDFKLVLASEIIKHNQRQGRNTATAKGRSFHDTFSESVAMHSDKIRVATEEQLKFCLLASESRSVLKRRGEIQFADHRYWSEDLTPYRGKKVMVRFDPDDLQRGVAVYTVQGRFITDAECVQEGEFNSLEDAKAHAAKQGKFIKDKRAKLAQALNLTPEEAAEMLPQIEEQLMPERKVVGLHTMPLGLTPSFGSGLTASLGVSNIFDAPGAKKEDG